LAKQLSNLNKSVDRTTLDLFETDKRPGRPKTNPYSRELQLKHNKRNQVKRDKANGLKRIEFKVSGTLYDALNEQARQQSVSRSELIESILNSAVSTAQV
jgi:predicted HicB family RNase H-like nuclease